MDGIERRAWFLAANTAEGFYSVYEELLRREGEYRVWYIKGGPGNGKSTFMRRVAEAAESAGCHAEYILCSGDPLSLDGVLIPEVKTIYVDATAPHVQEPSLPGAGGRYLDLSQFYKKTAALDGGAIRTIQKMYREQYERAYAYLSAAGKADPSAFLSSEERERRFSAGREAAMELLPVGSRGPSERRFLSANSCLGFISLPETACAYGKAYLIHGDTACAWLAGAAAACTETSRRHILCPDPLQPERLDAVIIPDAGTAFLKAHKGVRYPAANAVHIRPEPGSCEKEPEYKQAKSIRNALLRLAYGRLKKAKDLHDEMEARYRPILDVKALDRFTARHIREEFGVSAQFDAMK